MSDVAGFDDFGFGALAVCDVFSEIDDESGASGRIADQREAAVDHDHVAIFVDEALLEFEVVALASEEIVEGADMDFAFVGMSDGLPLIETAEFFDGIAQHIDESAIGEVLFAIDGEEVDADLGVFEYGAKLFFAGGKSLFGSENFGVGSDGGEKAIDEILLAFGE